MSETRNPIEELMNRPDAEEPSTLMQLALARHRNLRRVVISARKVGKFIVDGFAYSGFYPGAEVVEPQQDLPNTDSSQI